MTESKAEELSPIEEGYPKLMKDEDETVYLVSDYREAVVVFVGNDARRYIGEYSDSWVETIFKPFHGTITLSNK